MSTGRCFESAQLCHSRRCPRSWPRCQPPPSVSGIPGGFLWARREQLLSLGPSGAQVPREWHRGTPHSEPSAPLPPPSPRSYLGLDDLLGEVAHGICQPAFQALGKIADGLCQGTWESARMKISHPEDHTMQRPRGATGEHRDTGTGTGGARDRAGTAPGSVRPLPVLVTLARRSCPQGTPVVVTTGGLLALQGGAQRGCSAPPVPRTPPENKLQSRRKKP